MISISSRASVFIAGIFLTVLTVFTASADENKSGLMVPPGFEMVKAPVSDSNGWAAEIRHKLTGIEMVYVGPGEFIMGSPSSETSRQKDETPHKVKLTKGYYIGKYSVTQGQWEKIMGGNPSSFKDSGKDAPVEMVSWNDCQLLCKKIGYGFRLPTEAEWEFASRGGNMSKGFIYSGSDNLDEVGWYYENSGDRRLSDSSWNFQKLKSNNCRPHSVAQKKPNELGIYGMSGNVSEWCSDWYGDYPSELITDPSGALSGSTKVFRCGGWYNTAEYCRVARRTGAAPDYRGNDIGFRLAMDIPSQK